MLQGKKRKASGDEGSEEDEEEVKKVRRVYVINDEWMKLIKQDTRNNFSFSYFQNFAISKL